MSRKACAPRAPSAEVLGLYAGLRRAWRLRLPERELDTWRIATQRRGWSFAVAEYAVATAPGGHGMREQPGATRTSASTTRLVIVGRDLEDVDRALALETEALARPSTATAEGGHPDARLLPQELRRTVERHRELGALYGYPDCCVQAFSDAHLEVLLRLAPRVGDNLVAIVRAAERSVAFEPLLDTLDGGAFASQRSPLRHLPCRFDCPASVALANQLLALAADVRQAGPAAAAEALREALPPDDVILLADGSLVRLRVDEAAAIEPGRWPAAWFVAVDAADPALSRQLPALNADRQAPRGASISVSVEPGMGLRWRAENVERLVGASPDCPWGERLPLTLPFASGIGRLPTPRHGFEPSRGRDSAVALA